LYFDRVGNIWCGSYGQGVSYTNVEKNYFRKLLSRNDLERWGGNNNVHWIGKDHDNNTWCIMNDDGGFWKLRQISVGYDFTRFVPAKWPIKGVKLDFVAYNVLIIKKWVDNIDPETVGYGVDSMVGLESPGVPTTRSLGLNLNLKF
jgi:hypothetical protein